MDVPTDLYYSRDHEWLRIEDDVATVGITAFAAEALGDIVFVEPPRVGEQLVAGDVCGEIESTKSVSDLYSPVDGEVVEVNEDLADLPHLINSDPFGDGWLFRIRLDRHAELLDAGSYAELTEAE
jgi:glycine cleavage system H protein